MNIKCSLCPQIFDENDPLIEIIKKRHEQGRHSQHSVINQRTGEKQSKSGMGGLIIGTVEWIRICKHNIPVNTECTQCLIRNDLLLD